MLVEMSLAHQKDYTDLEIVSRVLTSKVLLEEDTTK
jgi:hypothetical protein